MRNGLQWFGKLKICAIVVMVIALCWTLTAKTVTANSYDWSQSTWSQGFTQMIDGQPVALAEITDFQDVAIGETLVLVSEIPDITCDHVLFFYSKDVEVRVFANDSLLYHFTMQDEFEFLKTPGNAWNTISIPVELRGASLRMELTSNFAHRYETSLSGLYLVEECETLAIILQREGFRMFMSLALLLMALFAFANSAIWKRPHVRKYFVRLGMLYLCTALWLFSMYSALDYFLQKPAFSYLLSMFMAIFLPVTLYELAKEIYTAPSRLVTGLGVMVWSNFGLQLLLQFVFGISLLNLLPLTYVIYGVGACLFIGFIVHHICTNRHHLNFELVTLVIILCGAVAEIIVLVVAPARTDLIGVCGVAGLFLYLLVNHFYLLVSESKIDFEKMELEENYNKLQNTTLMQQIKAHFFFNTLNTISALCKSDPKEADDAILVFAQYMRSYMQLINKHECIAFEKELEIVETSLKIEKMRFPDKFTYVLDLQEIDFMVPPLSIQPVVENCMLHGLRKHEPNGEILIQTKRIGDTICIIVRDNGVGFDTSQLENSTSIGLKNLQARVQIMTHGSVTIQSAPQQGTQTTFTLPIGRVQIP